MNTSRDTQLLREYEKELDTAVRERAHAQAEFDQVQSTLAQLVHREEALKTLVSGFRALIGDDNTNGSAPVEIHNEPAPVVATRRRRQVKGQPGLKSILYARLQQTGRLTVQEAREYLKTLPRYADNLPVRQTIVARLGDLTREGKALSDSQGEYRLSPTYAHMTGQLLHSFEETRKTE